MAFLPYKSFLTNHFNNCIITLAFQNAAMAQVVEHVLGKDEVTGSNPVSSSKNTEIRSLMGTDFSLLSFIVFY